MSDLERRAAAELSSGGRLLISRLEYLGDVILTLPAVRAVKDRYPNAEIDYLARSDGANVLEGEPLISRVLRVPEKGESALTAWRLIREMRSRRYAAAVDLYSNPRSALLTWLSGAPLRIGGARRVRKWLYTHPTVTPATVRSAIDHHLHAMKPLGVAGRATKPVLTLSDAERARALERLRNVDAPGSSDKIVGLHPGGKWEVKRWPVEHFADLARRLIDKHGIRIVVLIGPGEQSYQDGLRTHLGPRASYLPPLPIRETAAVIGALDGMVVADGGIMHVSVAVGTPTVGLFGSGEPDIWFPYESSGPFAAAYVPVECRPCHRHVCDHLSCLRGLSAERVESEFIRVLDAAKGNEKLLRR
jgi:lipopolysaccharide heptosyltransferase II